MIPRNAAGCFDGPEMLRGFCRPFFYRFRCLGDVAIRPNCTPDCRFQDKTAVLGAYG